MPVHIRQRRAVEAGFYRLFRSSVGREMRAVPPMFSISPLAPLQEVMLRDSLAEPTAGHHIEQVEIRFTAGTRAAAVVAAWAATVAFTEALQSAFVVKNGLPVGVEKAAQVSALATDIPVPDLMALWLETDRTRPVLSCGTTPWRVVYWSASRRLVWTFHHALLDGRSIARVLRNFLLRLNGSSAQPLALARWEPPSAAEIESATQYFRGKYALAGNLSAEPASPGPMTRQLGAAFLALLETRAALENVTAATVVLWAWGQVLAKSTGRTAVLAEQVRSGPPLPGTAGFTMNTLPIFISHCAESTEKWPAIRDLRTELLVMRAFESVSPADFPYGNFPDLSAPAVSVVMVERGSLRWQIQENSAARSLASIRLHESSGQSQLATAYLRPDFLLSVEGPHKSALVVAWAAALRSLVTHKD
jgi:hypothetical protein